MHKKIIIAIICICFAFFTKAQNVAINNSGATADASGILDVSSTSKGVLVPRMTKAQKTAIATPANALLVYQTGPDSVGFHYYDAPNTRWVFINANGFATDTTAWKVTGNSNITSANFLGTTNDTALNFRVKNQKSGTIDSINLNTSFGYGTLRNLNFAGGLAGKTNSAFGYRALDSNTTGFYNNAFGYNSMLSNKDGWDNSAFGNEAMKANTNGTGNSAFGAGTLFLNTTGNQNTAVGWVSSFNNTTGWYNTAVGAKTLDQNKETNGNTALGSYALELHRTNPYNTAIGHEALRYDTSGWLNTAVGWRSMWLRKRGNENTAVGVGTLENDTAGNYNVAIGRYAGFGLKKGDGNIFMGYQSGISADSSNYATFVGTYSGLNNRSNYNTAFGAYAMYNNNAGGDPTTQGIENTGLGYGALFANNLGSKNVAVGYQAMNGAFDIAPGPNRNVAVGDSAGFHLNYGASNVVIGTQAGANLFNGSFNVAIGDSALSSTAGNRNIAIGYKSQKNFAGSASSNIAVGNQSLAFNTNSLGNIAVGDSAMGASTATTAINVENLAIGSKALKTATYNSSTYFNFQNTAIGHYALEKDTTGSNNTAIGYGSLRNAFSSSRNIAIGRFAMDSLTSFTSVNIGIGGFAMRKNLGQFNIAMGDSAMYGVNPGFNSNNLAIGFRALKNNNSGTSNNIAIGNGSMYTIGSNVTGAANVALGVNSLMRITSGGANTAIGNSAANSLTTGGQNIAIGDNALGSNATGRWNVSIGAGSNDVGATGNGNISIGFWAGRLTNSYSNVAIGDRTGYYNTAINTVAIGDSALYLNTFGGVTGEEGQKNTAIGSKALRSNTRGYRNTAVGFEAGSLLSLGSNNTYMGTFAGYSANNLAQRNVAIGVEALYLNNDSNNVAIGFQALTRADGTGNIGIGSNAAENLASNSIHNIILGDSSAYGLTAGNRNVIIGTKSLFSGIGNDDNIFIGHRAVPSSTSGSDSNVVIGSGAGINVINGAKNTLMGANADLANNAITNGTAIGHNALVGASNSLVLGSINGVNGATSGVNVGIGISSPTQKLHVLAPNTIRNAGYFISANNTNYTSNGATLLAENNNTSITDAAGVIGRANAINNFGLGGYFEGGFIGLEGRHSSLSSATFAAYGVRGFAVNTNTATNYGIYGSAAGGATNWGGYFAGNVFTTGTYTPSDEMLKTNIKPMDALAVDKLKQLTIKSYQYNHSKYQNMNLPVGDQFGLMAQDLERIFPSLVTKAVQPAEYKDGNRNIKTADEVAFKAVNYTGLIPVLTKAIQEQQSQIDELKKQNELLIKRLEKLENK